MFAPLSRAKKDREAPFANYVFLRGHCPSSIAALMAIVATLSAPGHARAEYSAANTFDLNPTGFTQSIASAAGGAQPAGYGASSTTGGKLHALLWTGLASSYVDLHPNGFTESYAFAGTPSQQVGAGYGPGTATANHALLWTGSATSVVDLNPIGFDESEAFATIGTQQVGYGTGIATSYYKHALLWNGSAASYVDLNPTGYTYSFAYGIGGSQQVGNGFAASTANLTHALLWTGSAASAVDLNPTGFTESYAVATTGTQQLGYGYGASTGNNLHALTWSGSASSAVDLNPAGFLKSAIYATNGTLHVGFASGSSTGGNDHALLWLPSGTGYLDLNSLLPAGINRSYAQAIDSDGNIFGFAYVGTQPHAIEWLAAPRIMMGDFDRDGHTTPTDIPAMLVALTDLNSYQTTKSLTDSQLLAVGDINGDGRVSNADVQPLLDLLGTGDESIAGVPEPSSLVLLAIGILIMKCPFCRVCREQQAASRTY